MSNSWDIPIEWDGVRWLRLQLRLSYHKDRSLLLINRSIIHETPDTKIYIEIHLKFTIRVFF